MLAKDTGSNPVRTITKGDKKMAEIKKDCPWMVDMYGTSICRLNVLPCSRVPKNLCDQEGEDENDSKTQEKQNT